MLQVSALSANTGHQFHLSSQPFNCRQVEHMALTCKLSSHAPLCKRHCPDFQSPLYSTVKPLLKHTARWTAQAMGYERLWVTKHVLKIDKKIPFFFFSKTVIIIINCVRYLLKVL